MFKLFKSMLQELFDFSEYETVSADANSYALPPNISKQFDWQGYDSETGFFELNTGDSVAAIYELFPVATEGQSADFLEELRRDLMRLFTSNVFKLYYDKESPWIMQAYVSDDFNLTPTVECFKQHIRDHGEETKYTKKFITMFEKHIKYLTQPEGIFDDNMSDTRFRGRIRRMRIVVYRRMHAKAMLGKRQTPVSELRQLTKKLETFFHGMSIQYKKYNEYDFYSWMIKWLSPAPRGFRDTDDYINTVRFPNEDEKTANFSLTRSVFTGVPKSDEEKNIWLFDKVPHKYIPLAGFNAIPSSGHLTAERQMTKNNNPSKIKYYAVFDHLPEGSTFMMTVVFQHQEIQKRKNDRIKKQTDRISGHDADMAAEEAEVANRMIALGNNLYPLTMGVYIYGKTEVDLLDKEEELMAVLNKANLKVFSDEQTMHANNRYIKHLPMNYNYAYDKKYHLQSRLCSIKQIASIFPVYGRTRGTGSYSLVDFNRLGEPVTNDPILDRVNNAHGFLCGTTGSGKSNRLTTIMMSFLASNDVRNITLVDAGESFKYFVDLCECQGLSVDRIVIDNKPTKITLNPFVATKQMLKQVEEIEALNQSIQDYEEQLNQKIESAIDDSSVSKANTENADDEKRDYLMEFTNAAVLMITGGDEKELKDVNRQDIYFVLEAIKCAAKVAVENGFDQMIPTDLINSMELMVSEKIKGNENDQLVAKRLSVLANGLKMFISSPLNAKYFNRRGNPISEKKITYLELGIWKANNPSNEAPRALAVITLMNHTMTVAEKYKTSGKPMYLFVDECHSVMSKPITAASIVQCTKMSRKVSLWIWLATQHLADFPDFAAKAITMLEYKFILYSESAERKKIVKFADLTPEQDIMIQSLRKEPRKYVECLMVSANDCYIFRSVPIREILALTMTDDKENAWREKLEKEFNCSGLEACFLMAQNLYGEAYDINKVRALLHD